MSTQVEVWTLLVNDGNGRESFVTVHATERDAMDALRVNYDEAGEYPNPIPAERDNWDAWVESFTGFMHIDAGIDKHVIDMSGPDYQALFVDLFVKVAESEPPEGSQLDEVLTDFQEQFDVASATDSAVCRHCFHGILRQPSGVWIAPDAGLDREFGDGMWRDICPDNDDHPNPPHEPGA